MPKQQPSPKQTHAGKTYLLLNVHIAFAGGSVCEAPLQLYIPEEDIEVQTLVEHKQDGSMEVKQHIILDDGQADGHAIRDIPDRYIATLETLKLNLKHNNFPGVRFSKRIQSLVASKCLDLEVVHPWIPPMHRSHQEWCSLLLSKTIEAFEDAHQAFNEADAKMSTLATEVTRLVKLAVSKLP